MTEPSFIDSVIYFYKIYELPDVECDYIKPEYDVKVWALTLNFDVNCENAENKIRPCFSKG
jgi:hypothetical protein